jgi:cell surface protein SprA
VWPSENNVKLDLKKLVKVKEHRDEKIREGAGILYNMIYTENIDGARYTVKGTPTISAIKSILIGVRNPQKRRIDDGDDGEAKSIEVWMNEMSLNGFGKENGVAATARMQANLGDVGNISVATSFTEANFGQIEDRVMDLSLDNVLSYDVAVNLEAGRFLPPKAGIQLPVHYDISSTISNPEFNPLNPDVKTADDLKTYTPEDRQEIKKQIQDYTIRQNVNFINVRKERGSSSNKSQMPWDIENFNLSYSYSNTKHRNIDVEYDNQTMHKGGIGYDFSIQPKYFIPFAKTKMAKNKLSAFISDFNFNYIPNKFSFTTNIQRDYNENKLRDKSSFGEILIEPTFFKRFDWVRVYNFRYDITKSITLTYNANANSFLREPFGAIDTKEKTDSIWRSFMQGGSMRNFDQVVKITYDLPIYKLPFMEWVKANVGYGATYRWEAGALAIQDLLGNTISNNRTLDGSGKLDFVKLYNYIPYLKKINSTSSQNRRARSQRSNQIQGKEKDDKEDNNIGQKIAKGFLRFLMLVRDASITYNRSESMILPGFMPEPDLFGNDLRLTAPGFGFAFGSQEDIRYRAGERGWLSTSDLQNNPYSTTFSQTINARATIEPFNDFRITLSMDYGQAENHSSYYKYYSDINGFKATNPMMGGNYRISTILLATAFSKADKHGNSAAFDKFLDNRLIVAERLAAENPYYTGIKTLDSLSGQMFPVGYKSNQQEVMLLAFLSAYSGVDASRINLSPMKRFPLPNWNLNYNGLTKIKGMRKIFKNFSLSHAYTSSYNIGSYTNNLLFSGWEDMRYALDPSDNYISQYIMDGIVLREDFAPLIKISATLQNDLSLNFEYRKSRQLGLSFVNNQLTESNRSEWVIGGGYRIKNVGFKVRSGGSSRRQVQNDIILRADISLRDEKVLVRRIDQHNVQPSSGAFMCSLNTYAEYEITKQISVKAFVDFTYNSPYIASQYLTITSRGGFTIIYKLVQ